MVALYLLLLIGAAALTAYAQSAQRTLIEIGDGLDDRARRALMPRAQRRWTAAMIIAWPLALVVGLLFVQWWKAMALAVGAYLLLVPVMATLVPRPMSDHHIDRLRGDLDRRIEKGEGDTDALRRAREHLG